MSNTTKRALEASLKKLLLQKPLDKITIQDLTTDCGISRMAFYYHLKISMIWLNGHAWRTESGRCRENEPTIPGRKG